MCAVVFKSSQLQGQGHTKVKVETGDVSLAVLLYFICKWSGRDYCWPVFLCRSVFPLCSALSGFCLFKPIRRFCLCTCSGPFASWRATRTPWWPSRCTTRSAPRPSATSSTKVLKVSASFACKLPALRSCVSSAFQPPYRRWSATFPTRPAWFWTASAGKANR